MPHWHYPYERLAYWDIFGRPQTLPSQTAALMQIWWIDPEKQKALADRTGPMMGNATAIGRAAARTTGLLAILLASTLLSAPALAEFRHGLSAFGDLKYPADFKHFDYVNPDAPKGGRLSTIGTEGRTTFDSFNDFILKGDAAQGLEYLFDTLMTRAGRRARRGLWPRRQRGRNRARLQVGHLPACGPRQSLPTARRSPLTMSSSASTP